MLSPARVWVVRCVAFSLGVPLLLAISARAEDSGCVRRTLPLSVVAPDTQSAKASAGDLRGSFRDMSVKILSLVKDDRPHRIVILLDTSGSMSENFSNHKWKLALSVASHLAKEPPANSSVALLFFSDQVLGGVDFSKGSVAVSEILQRIENDPDFGKKYLSRRTAILDSLLAGLRLLKAPTSADVLCVVSDGEENASRSSEAAVKQALLKTGARVFLAHVENVLEMEEAPEIASPDQMERIVKATGGAIFVFPDTTRLAGRRTKFPTPLAADPSDAWASSTGGPPRYHSDLTRPSAFQELARLHRAIFETALVEI